MEKIYIIGFMGTGKTEVGKALAEKTGWKLFDIDSEIVKEQGREISAIFAREGEPAFRNIESLKLRETAPLSRYIIPTGGGIVLKEENIQLMKKCGVVVLLTAEPEEIFRRLKNDSTRPLLKDKKSAEDIKGLLETRKEKYFSAADIIIDTNNKTEQKIADEILTAYRGS